MADRTYRGPRDRYDRDRPFSRQAEQFDDYSWRDDERGFGQMEGWREEDYGQFDTAGQSYDRDRHAARDWGRDPSYRAPGEYRSGSGGGYASRYGQGRGFDSFTGSDFGGRDFSAPRYTRSPLGYGAGSQLAANHGEWRESYGGVTPSREQRDYRGTWGGRGEGRNWLDRASDTVAGWFSDDDDRRSERGYRGQGPSGYTRSDERIMEDACDRLTDDWAVDARQISVTVNGGEVTLEGTVPSRDQKRRAEDVIDDLSGVKNVQNNLRVQQPAAWDRSSRETEPTGTL